MKEQDKERMIQLLIQSVEGAGEEEGVWYGLDRNEISELENLLINYKVASTIIL